MNTTQQVGGAFGIAILRVRGRATDTRRRDRIPASLVAGYSAAFELRLRSLALRGAGARRRWSFSRRAAAAGGGELAVSADVSPPRGCGQLASKARPRRWVGVNL